MPPEVSLATVVRFGVFDLDPDAGELRKAGIRLRLQKQPLEILKILVQRSGEVVTREELCSGIWSDDTFVDFDNNLNTAINKLRDVLGDTASSPRFIETVPRLGYRFIAPVTTNPYHDIAGLAPASRRTAKWKFIAVGLAVVALVAGTFWFPRSSRVPAQRTAILVADFANRTGDSVFDGTLRQGLSVQIEQSPWLNVVTEEQISETLHMMGRPGTAELSPEVAHEVCQRTNSEVAVDGSIALIGTQYDLVLRAVDCARGDLLGSAEERAQDKNHVLDAVSKLASTIRQKLGESLSSVRRYDTPLARATTASLEALQCYTQGVQAQAQRFDYTGSLHWFQQALEADHNFAMAYWSAGEAYGDLGESNSARSYMRKAFELREPVSQREKWLIEGGYYYFVLGDLDKARQSLELLIKVYPDTQSAHNSVADIAEMFGDYDTGLAEYRQGLQLSPKSSLFYRDVANTYLALGRIDDAVAVARAAGVDSNLASVLYSIAFYRNDRAEMTAQVAAASGKPGIEDLLIQLDADTAAYFGHLDKARSLSRRAAELAQRMHEKETSAQYDAASSLRDALLGKTREAGEQQAIARNYQGPGRDLTYGIALALSYSGDLKESQILTDNLAKDFPEDTIVHCNYLPTLRARIAIMQGTPERAIDSLVPARDCELGLPAYSYYNWPNLYPVYVRGEAYLAAHRGAEAVSEFQKIIDHRGIVLNEPIGALAYLQLGRAYAAAGSTAKAKAAYQDFLALWKEADADVPIMRQAKAEYAKLQ